MNPVNNCQSEIHFIKQPKSYCDETVDMHVTGCVSKRDTICVFMHCAYTHSHSMFTSENMHLLINLVSVRLTDIHYLSNPMS